jgi:hypothetical protein
MQGLNATELSCPTWRSSCTQRISVRSTPGMATKAVPSCSAFTANWALWAGDIGLPEKAIGRLDRGDSGQGQSLHQSVLQGLKHTLRAASCLRRIGRDMLDTQMRQRPTNLGGSMAIDRTTRLGRVEIVAAAIGLEAQRQAMLSEHLQQSAERRGRALLRREKRRVDRVRCVIHRHDQVHGVKTRQPLMP